MVQISQMHHTGKSQNLNKRILKVNHLCIAILDNIHKICTTIFDSQDCEHPVFCPTMLVFKLHKNLYLVKIIRTNPFNTDLEKY